jgi:hypothetical protein
LKAKEMQTMDDRSKGIERLDEQVKRATRTETRYIYMKNETERNNE